MCPYFVAGANNDAVHRFLGPDIQQLFRVLGGEGRGGRWRQEYRRFFELRGRPLVGRDHGDDHRLRRHGAQDLDGEDRRFVLQCLRYFVFRSSSRK